MSLSKKEKDAIDLLNKLSHKWPKSLELFSDNGTLLVIKNEEVIEVIFGIPNDGGDAGTTVDEGGREWLGR